MGIGGTLVHHFEIKKLFSVSICILRQAVAKWVIIREEEMAKCKE